MHSGTDSQGNRYVTLAFGELMDVPADGMFLGPEPTGATVAGLLAWRAAGLAGMPADGTWSVSLRRDGSITFTYDEDRT